MSTHITIKVPVNAKRCVQMAYDVLVSPENFSTFHTLGLHKKIPPYIDELLLHAFVGHANKYEYFITAKEVSPNESEMTVICAFYEPSRFDSTGVECRLISLFLKCLSQKIQNSADL